MAKDNCLGLDEDSGRCPAHPPRVCGLVKVADSLGSEYPEAFGQGGCAVTFIIPDGSDLNLHARPLSLQVLEHIEGGIDPGAR